MKLTRAQQTQIDKERKSDPQRASFFVEATSEQDAEFETAAAEEDAGRLANEEFCRRLDSLLNENSFVGSLRRSLDASEQSWEELERDCGIPALRIQQFYSGDADLTQSDIDRLVASLGLQLVPTAN